MTVGELAVMFGIKSDGSLERVRGQINGFVTGAARAFRTLGLGFGAIGLIKTLTGAGDEYSNMHSRLALVAKDQEEVNALFARAQTMAKDTRASLSGTVNGFVKIAQSVSGMGLGLTNMEVFDRLELLQKQMKTSGSSTQASNAAFTQLMQGLGSNRLGGEEIRSVLEQLPSVADQLAKHLGVTRGKLREISKEGKITAKVILDAFGPQYADSINAQFAKIKATNADHWQALKNQVVVTFGKLANDINLVEVVRIALEAFAKVIVVIADGIRLIADLIKSAMGGSEGAQAVLIGLAVAIMTFVVPALWAMAAPVLAFMLPLLAVAAVVALIAYGVLKLIKYAPQIRDALGGAWDWVKRKAQEFWDWLTGIPGRMYDLAADMGQAIIDAFAAAWEAVKQMSEDAIKYLGDKIESIPIFGLLPKAGRLMGEGAGYLASGGGPGSDLDAIDVIGEPMTNAHGANSNISVQAPMNINIHGVKDADQATGAIGDVVQNQMRHAMHDAGGQ